MLESKNWERKDSWLQTKRRELQRKFVAPSRIGLGKVDIPVASRQAVALSRIKPIKSQAQVALQGSAPSKSQYCISGTPTDPSDHGTP